MIVLQHVHFHYAGSEHGVHDISLTVRDGECVVLTGPSGGGKTTLLRLINGLAPAYYAGELCGDIFLDGVLLRDMPVWKISRDIGSVFQDPKSQFFSSDLAGEVAFACENYGMSREEIRRRTDGAMAAFELDALRGRPLDVLSSGEKQRTAIASVYALAPHIYVCDEPTANLDEQGTAELAAALQKLKSAGNTLLLAEHRLSWLAGLADRFCCIADGRLVWERTGPEMRALSAEACRKDGLRRMQTMEMAVPPLPMTLTAPLLSAEELCCRRGGKTIFEHIRLSLPPGKIVALTGHNGAGKTTLAMVLTGLLRESGGTITIAGRKASPGQRRKHIWYSSNDTGTQFFTDSVTDELLLGRKSDAAQRERAGELLQKLGLFAYKDCHPAALSGGQKQRLSIACGILSDRPIMLLDEPTSGLDGGNMEIIAGILEEEAQAGKSILVITHDTEWLNRCCSYVCSMDS